MNAEIFAEWLRRHGHQVFRTESSYWYDAGMRVYQAFPYHWLIKPQDKELSILFKKHHVLGLRYSTPIGSSQGCISYHAVLCKPNYKLEDLDRRSRQNVRVGLRNCHIEKISIERLAEEGLELENDTASRQNRDLQLTKDRWRLRYQAAANLPGFEAWGALVGERLVASILLFQMEDTIELISQQCHRDFLKARVNNALAFKVTESMVRRPGIRSVFYTLQSLDAPASVDEFKFRLGYTPKPVRQKVVFHPLISPAVNHFTYKGLKWLRDRRPDKPLFTKAEGVVRFYLSGKLSALNQEWPECLSSSKEELLKKLNPQTI
jgi:hypothetical protein